MADKLPKSLGHPDNLHLRAAQGWLELGNHLEANEELEQITPQLRAHPDVLEIRWHIYAHAKKWDACLALGKTHLIIDRDTKYCEAFRQILASAGVKIVLCSPRVPQCNAFAERFVPSIKEEGLSRLIFLSEQHLRATPAIFTKYYQRRRNHQAIANRLIEPLEPPERLPTVGRIRCQQELGGTLNYYCRKAA